MISRFFATNGPRRARDLAWVAMLILASVAGVCLTFSKPELCAVLMAGVLAAALARWHTRQDILVAVTGFVVGPSLEVCATRAGLWSYPFTTFGPLPAWVFTLWPAFPVVLIRLTHTLRPVRPGDAPRPSLDLAVGGLILATEIPLLTLFGNSHPWPTAAGTFVMLVAAALVLRSPQATLMLLLSGTFGTLCEWMPIHCGAWKYPDPAFLGMPAWLPTGYALFGFGLVRVALGVSGAWTTTSKASAELS